MGTLGEWVGVLPPLPLGSGFWLIPTEGSLGIRSQTDEVAFLF